MTQWMRLDCTLPRNPKTLRLAAKLQCSRHEAVGILVELWSWAVLYCIDGDLSRFTAEEVCYAIDQDPTCWQSLVDAGFIEETAKGACIHDWADFQGRLIQARQKNAERQRRYAQRRKADKPLANALDSVSQPLADAATNEQTNDTSLEEEDTLTAPSSSRVTKRFREEVVEAYKGKQTEDEILAAIEEARGHSSIKKWTDNQGFIWFYLKNRWGEPVERKLKKGEYYL